MSKLWYEVPDVHRLWTPADGLSVLDVPVMQAPCLWEWNHHEAELPIVPQPDLGLHGVANSFVTIINYHFSCYHVNEEESLKPKVYTCLLALLDTAMWFNWLSIHVTFKTYLDWGLRCFLLFIFAKKSIVTASAFSDSSFKCVQIREIFICWQKLYIL